MKKVYIIVMLLLGLFVEVDAFTQDKRSNHDLGIMKIITLQESSLIKELQNMTINKLVDEYNFINLYYNPKQLQNKLKFEQFVIEHQQLFEVNLKPQINLYISIMMNDQNLIQKFIDIGANVDEYYLCVIKGVQKKYYTTEILKFYKLDKAFTVLINNNFDPYKHKKDELFAKAIENESIEEIEYILEQGIDIKGGAYNSPIIDSANNSQILKLLIQHGADVNSTYSSGETALINAVYNKNLESARILLENGADIDAYYSDDIYHTPIQIAVSNDDEKMIELLQEYGANSVIYTSLENGVNSFKAGVGDVIVGVGFAVGMLIYLIGVEISGEY